MSIFAMITGLITSVNYNISDRGLEHIKSYEGFRAEPYQDSAGHWTIGYGHKIREGEKFDKPLTEEEALALLRKDVKVAEDAVKRLVKVDLTQNQRDSLISFVFNVGQGNFKSSTMLKKLNVKDYTGANAEFSKWVYAGGKVLNGLKKRRVAEAQMFLD